MSKHADNIEKLWSNTIPIDTWIIEHIRFFMNEWRQSIQPGSNFLTAHGTNQHDGHGLVTRDYDLLSYTTHPLCDKVLFYIRYYDDYCSISGKKDESEDSTRLEFAHPEFFDKLEQNIWRARTIHYIMADLEAIARNLSTVRDTMWSDQDRLISSTQIGVLFESTGELDKSLRDLVDQVTGKEAVLAYPELDGHRVVPEAFDEYEQDQIPF